jgi:hypothetical protein
MVAVVDEVTAEVGTTKDVEVLPAGTVTLAGVGAMDGSVEASPMVKPPDGAGASILTVKVALVPAVTEGVLVPALLRFGKGAVVEGAVTCRTPETAEAVIGEPPAVDAMTLESWTC